MEKEKQNWKEEFMEIKIKKRLSERFPYYYAQNCGKEYGDWRYERTYYFWKWALVIRFIRN